ncbi:hypothetical protein ACGFZU_38005 [Streptomyces tendae]|uniref:hypothetical protein n=1 Tax=Streptomyces tendae TaxID=1932 RepID=UPI00371A61E4
MTMPPETTDSPYQSVYHEFYRTIRAGAAGLSDGGGPFGFDITAAIAFDDMVRAYQPDALVETGCYFGDTTSYLSRAYPGLPVWSCDIDPACAALTRQRTAAHANVSVLADDSPAVVQRAAARFERPLFYLDAHGKAAWPLAQELAAIREGIVCIDDFDIGNPRFAFDHYDGVRCDAAYVLEAAQRVQDVYRIDPEADYPFPCLQTGRRAGKGMVPFGAAAEELCATQPRLAHQASRQTKGLTTGGFHVR